MRRDLTRGCAACRLRFSALLTHCPVCRGISALVEDATLRVQPTSRAAWLAKWAILLPCIPAIGAVAWMGTRLLKEGWPPQNALDVLNYTLGSLATCLGASLVVAIPLALWFGVIRVIQFVLKFIVDRPRRTLRVSIELVPLSSTTHSLHPIPRLWKKLSSFITKHIEDSTRLPIYGILLFLGMQTLAEIFGNKPFARTSSFKEFGEGILILAIVDFMGLLVAGLLIAAFGALVEKAKEFFAKPPNLFGYDPNPPPVQNETCLETFTRQRHEIVGRAAALDAVERATIEAPAMTELRAPLSGQTCLAFRLQGEAADQPVDDADAMNFALVTEDGQRCVVTNSDCVVAFSAETKVEAYNSGGFLEERGLPERALSIREGLLREGDLVRVVGRRTEIRLGTAGYRGDERRMMIDAGDGLPVVILAANAAPS